MKSIIHMLDGTSSLIIIIVTDNVWWEPQRPPKGRTKQWPTQKPYSESRGVNFIRISKFIQLVIHSTNQVPIIVQLLYNTGNRTVNLSTPTITDIQCIWIILFSSILPLKNIGYPLDTQRVRKVKRESRQADSQYSGLNRNTCPSVLAIPRKGQVLEHLDFLILWSNKSAP